MIASNPQHNADGFTLIELSIVLVIIGLIIGGVLIGRDLIKTAELRSVISQIEKYQTAVNTFKLKYNALPGDMADATSIWGAANADPTTCTTTASTGTETCNGDGGGSINSYQDSFRFWQQLANAGLIAGQYNGIKGGAGSEAVAGVNVPASSISGAYFFINPWPIIGANYHKFGSDLSLRNIQISIGNTGSPTAGTNKIMGGGGVLSNQAAYSIDIKNDDGLADYGRWRTNLIPDSGANYSLGRCAAYTPSDETTKCVLGYWFAPWVI